MTKDICYFLNSDVASVYNAYLMAIRSNAFRGEPTQEPYCKMEFGVSFSLKYNLNGGSCTLCFMPYQNGTAVKITLFIVQLCGARCGAYARDLSNEAAAYLRVAAQEISIDVNLFSYESNKVRLGTPPTQSAANAQGSKFCTACGSAQPRDAKFCSLCGANIEVKKTVCPTCGAPIKENAKFCTNCGNKIL